MWSCFEDLIARNSIVQSKLNLILNLESITFFRFALVCMHDDIINSVLNLHADMQFLSSSYYRGSVSLQ